MTAPVSATQYPLIYQPSCPCDDSFIKMSFEKIRLWRPEMYSSKQFILYTKDHGPVVVNNGMINGKCIYTRAQ